LGHVDLILWNHQCFWRPMFMDIIGHLYPKIHMPVDMFLFWFSDFKMLSQLHYSKQVTHENLFPWISKKKNIEPPPFRIKMILQYFPNYSKSSFGDSMCSEINEHVYGLINRVHLLPSIEKRFHGATWHRLSFDMPQKKDIPSNTQKKREITGVIPT
jgi:hypothetical protein